MPKVNAIVVGTGGMARNHIRRMLQQARTTSIQALVEVSEPSQVSTRALFKEAGRPCPPFYRSIRDLLKNQPAPDAAFIVTPHKFHFDHARSCLSAGLDVLLEKPMVINARQAQRLIDVHHRSGRILVVAFQGGLSPAVHKAKKLIEEGRIGRVTGVSAYIHQSWKKSQIGKWRQDPEISGGGFLFDSGSHMVNTIVTLIGEEVKEVTAILDRAGTPVEINSSVSGKFRNGVLFSMAGFGDSIGCVGSIRVFGDEGIIETGPWGKFLRIRGNNEVEYKDVSFPRSSGVWQQFLRIRAGKMVNPSPPQVGLRFAQFMDMIRRSADSGRKVGRRFPAAGN